MHASAALVDDHVLSPVPPSPLWPPRAGSMLPGAVPPSATERASRSRPQHLLDLACKVLEASWGGIGLFAADGELIDHITTGLSEDTAVALGRSPALMAFLTRTLSNGAPVWGTGLTHPVADWAKVVDLPTSDAFLAVPLASLGRYRGLLYVVRPPGLPEFAALDAEKLQPICACLDHASLFEETHLLAQLRLLNQVIQAAAGNLDLSRIVLVALRELDRNLPMHRGAVWLLEETGRGPGPVGDADKEMPFALAPAPRHLIPDELVLCESSVAFGGDADLGLIRGTRLPLDETPFVSCIRDGQALYADLRRPEERQTPVARSLAEGGATAYFAVPMRVGDRTVGVLLSVCLRPSGFTGEQIQLLYLVADLLGPALSNCQMFGRLTAAYEELQRTQGQLIQSEKMRALGELAGGMAHDFNNSLCGVLGFLELALMDPTLAESGRGYLESARACALDAAQSVTRVQDFARWRRNEQEWQLVDVSELARKTVELTRPKWESQANFRQAPINLQVSADAEGRIKGNPAELRNALTNLVLNAVDAMPHGGTLTVRTRTTAADAFVEVRDTGVGMDEKTCRRVFEPFFSTKGERGTGLGLSAAFGIVRRHDGEITVESAVGRGSTFTVRLPLAAAPECGSGTSEGGLAGPSPAALRKPSLRTLRILVIDDEESIRRFLGNALQQLGHHARLEGDAQTGLAAFAEEAFDVVVTDLGLPGVSGEEVARAIAERAPQTPVILLTGWADQIESEQKTFTGVTRVLGKPVSLSTLVATLNKVVSG